MFVMSRNAVIGGLENRGVLKMVKLVQELDACLL